MAAWYTHMRKYHETAVPNCINTENSLDILDISKLAGQSLPDFVFVYLHFKIPPY